MDQKPDIVLIGKKFFTPSALAKALGKKPATLCWWRSRGKGPHFIKLGNSVLYPEDLVEAWIRAQVKANK